MCEGKSKLYWVCNQFERVSIKIKVKQLNIKKMKKMMKNTKTINTKTTEEYLKFIEVFSKRIKTSHPSIEIKNRNGILDTNDINRNLKLKVNSFSTLFQDFSFGIILNPIKNGVCIHNFLVSPFFQHKGIGSQIMKLIGEISDELEIPIYLIPVPTTDYGIDDDKLRSFYHSFGYKREKTSVYWKNNSVRKLYNNEYKMVG